MSGVLRQVPLSRAEGVFSSSQSEELPHQLLLRFEVLWLDLDLGRERFGPIVGALQLLKTQKDLLDPARRRPAA